MNTSIKSFKFLLIASIFFLLNPVSWGEMVGKSIALVNGEAVFYSEFEENWSALIEQNKKMEPDKELKPEWVKKNRELLLNQMIEEKLLLQEANRKKIVVPKRQLEEGIMQVKSRFKILPPGAKPSKEDFERELKPAEKADFMKELKEQNLTEKAFEDKIGDQLKVMKLTEQEVKERVPSPFIDNKNLKPDEPRELASEYEKETKSLFADIEKKFNQPDFKPDPESDLDQMVGVLKPKLGETIKASHILIKSTRKDDRQKRSQALEKLRAITQKLNAGADFYDVAVQSSEGPSAKSGGELGTFAKGQMVPEFEKAAFVLPVGGTSDIVETEFGYHLIHVEEKKAARRLKYDDIKMDLAGYLYQKRGQEKYELYVSELRKKADVEILIDLSKAIDG